MSELSPREKRSIDELYSILATYRREIDRIARAQDTRLTTLGPNDAINFVDGEGKPVARIGGSGAYGYSSDLVQYLDGPVPDAPGEPLIEGGAGVIRVTLGDGAEPADARMCRVHASTDAGFEPSYATVVGALVPGTSTVAISIPAGTWHCCVQWLTLSGKESEVSPVVTVEVDAMVDLSELDEVRAEADQKWADFAVREAEYQAAIADADARITAAEQLFESMPEPLELEEAVQQAQDAIAQLGDVTGRLQTAETEIQTVATEASQNLAALETTLTNSFTTGIQDAKTEIAANAQTEYDRLQAAADQALEAAVTGGGNLYPDPSFEMGGKGLISSARYSIVEDSRARHGSHVMLLGDSAGFGIGQPSKYEPCSPGDWYYSEMWVYRSDAAQTGTLSMTIQTVQASGASGASRIGAVEIADLPLNEWVKVAGTTQVSTSTTAPRVGVRYYPFVASGGNPSGVLIDSFKYINVNAAQEALVAAQSAQARAEAAHDLAGDAEANAQLAMTAAGQKTRVNYSTAAPSGTASEGDVWRRRDANNVIIGEWVRVGNSWVSTALSGGMVSNMDIGYLTAGASTIGTAVIEQILADGVRANILEAARAVIAARNIAPSMTEESAWTLSGTATFEDRTQSSTGRAIRMTPHAGTGVSGMAISPVFEVAPGDQIRFSTKMGRIGSGRPAGGQWYFGFMGVDASGSTISFGPYVASAVTASNDWDTVYEGIVTVPAGVTLGRIRLLLEGNAGSASEIASNAHTTFYDVRVTNMVDGSMVVENGITAREVNVTGELVAKILGVETAVADVLIANSELWARSATIINASLQNLSVTEKANFVDAFAETFWTNDLAARTALLGRAIIAAPNILPAILSASGAQFWSGLTVHAADPSIRIDSQSTVTPPGIIYLEGGVEYHYSIDVAGGVTGTRFALKVERDGTETNVTDDGSGGPVVGAGTRANWARHSGIFSVPVDGEYQLKIFANHSSGVADRQWFRAPRIERMQDGRLFVDGSIMAQKLDVDEIWANSTWQGEAYFGSSDATYQTRVNGQGLEVLRTDDTGDRVPAVALGSGELGLTFWDEEGEPTGSITHDGYVSGDLVSAQRNVIIAGQPLVGALENIPDGLAILDAFPKGEIARGEQNMQNQSMSGTTVWLFMECDAAHVYQGRSYRIEVEPFSISEDVSMFLDFNYTLNGSHPHGGTSNAGTLRSADRTFQGSLRFTPATDGLLRIGPKIRRASSGTISFPNSFATVKMTIYDEGLATPGGGMRRNATSGNQDPQGLQREYHSAWTPTWYQTYRDGSRYTWPRPLRGRDSAGRLYSSQVGGYRSALSTAGSNGEQGVTIGNALNGAELLSGSISIQAQSTPASSGGWFRIYWHTNTSSPNSFSPTTTPPNYIDYLVLSGGQTGRLPLPQACLDAIKNGTFGGFSFHPGGSTQGYMGITGLDGRTTAQPILRLRYHR